MKDLMKTIQLVSLFVAAILINTATSAQSKWQADPAHSKVAFSTVHNTISDVSGLFNTFEISLVASETDFSDAVFELSIDAASINTQIKMRDDHLRSADFFEVEKFSKITFKSASISKTGNENHYVLTGDLTMHGVTKTVTMDMWYRGTITDAQSGNEIAGFQIVGELNRLDFGVGSKFPDAIISNKVAIKTDSEFIKQK